MQGRFYSSHYFKTFTITYTLETNDIRLIKKYKLSANKQEIELKKQVEILELKNIKTKEAQSVEFIVKCRRERK